MSQENVELVRRIHEDWAQGRMVAGVDVMHPDIHFESFMPDSDQRHVARGPREIEAFLRGFLAQWRDYRITAEEVVAVAPDRVLVSGRQSATGRGSGIVVDDGMHSVWTFRDGRVVRLHFERDRERAREAAGVGS